MVPCAAAARAAWRSSTRPMGCLLPHTWPLLVPMRRQLVLPLALQLVALVVAAPAVVVACLWIGLP